MAQLVKTPSRIGEQEYQMPRVVKFEITDINVLCYLNDRYYDALYAIIAQLYKFDDIAIIVMALQFFSLAANS
jgi:hypothetical protein